ncbi:hypothetical protein C8T65DRAFT_668519 [Cerioporus squamosus]|nr:hypothetical protein C8T65DRAFT_668484 [Cerioporus squamosus]KAI0693139.1 hypothetical protein C8T65DRAFT_668519 [Cerioporus squamosus]
MGLSVARVLQQRLPGTLCRRVLAAPHHACPGRPSCVRKPLSPSRTTRDGILDARAPGQTWVSPGLPGDVSRRHGPTPTHLHVGAAPSRRPQAARNHSGLPHSTGGATYDVPVAKDVCVELRPQQTSSRWSSSGLLTATTHLVVVTDASRRSLASSRRDSRAADGGEMLVMFGLWSLPAVPGAPGLFSDFQSSDAGSGPSQVLCARSRADTGRGGICASRGQHASAVCSIRTSDLDSPWCQRRDIAAAEGRHTRRTRYLCQRERVAAVRKVRSCVRVGDGDSSFDSQLSLPAVQGAPGLSSAASSRGRCQRVASARPE